MSMSAALGILNSPTLEEEPKSLLNAVDNIEIPLRNWIIAPV